MALPFFKPKITKERYILDSLERLLPGKWVDDRAGRGKDPVGAHNPEQPGAVPGPATYITVIGGTKYDQEALSRRVLFSDVRATFVIGDGRGTEEQVYNLCESLCRDCEWVPVNHDMYGKAARKVNVDDVLNYAPDSPLLLVGTGERVKQARSWLKRTQSKREVVEIP